MLTLIRAFRNIWRRRFRTLLVSLVLALCVAVFVSTIAGVDASEDATAEMLADYEQAAETTIEQTEMSMTAITVMSMGRFMSGGGMEEAVADGIAAMENVAAVVPTVRGGFGEVEEEDLPQGPAGPGGGIGGFAGRRSAYQVTGVPLDAALDGQYSPLPSGVTEGRSLAEGDDYAVIVANGLTDYFDAGVGDAIDIEGTSFEVVGVFATSFMQNEVYMSLPIAQELLDMEGQLSTLTVYANSVEAVDGLVADIQEAYPDFMVMAMSDMQQSQFGDRILEQQEGIIGTTQQNLSSIQSLGLNITIVSAIIGVLLIFGLMFYTVRERTKEIGTLKALGFSNGSIMRQFMFEGMYIGIIGGAIGLGIGAAAASAFSAWMLNSSETLGAPIAVSITIGSILLGLCVAVVAGAVGSLYPAWRASRVSPMEALRND